MRLGYYEKVLNEAVERIPKTPKIELQRDNGDDMDMMDPLAADISESTDKEVGGKNAETPGSVEVGRGPKEILPTVC